MDLIEAFARIWSLGLIVFGLHFLLLGYLTIKSDYVPKFWGGLLVIAGICYMLIHSAPLLPAQFQNLMAAIEPILSVPMAISEIGFAIWLIIKGGKVTATKRDASVAAV